MEVSRIVGQPCRFVAFVMHESTQTLLLGQGFSEPTGAHWIPRYQQSWGGRESDLALQSFNQSLSPVALMACVYLGNQTLHLTY